MSGHPTAGAIRALALEFKSLQEEPVEGFRVKLVNEDNLFEWEVAIFGPPETLYEGGYFKARVTFPIDYPYSPPVLKFLTKVWHPNVYEVSDEQLDSWDWSSADGRPTGGRHSRHVRTNHRSDQRLRDAANRSNDCHRQNGDLCISILHPPIDDPQSGELPCERWNPTQNVRTILLSVISLLNEPNTFSPANVDASVMYRRWKESKGKDKEYENIIRKQVTASRLEAEKDNVVVPTTLEEYCIKHRNLPNEGETEMTDFYDDDYDLDDDDEEEEDEEDNERYKEDNEDSGNGES